MYTHIKSREPRNIIPFPILHIIMVGRGIRKKIYNAPIHTMKQMVLNWESMHHGGRKAVKVQTAVLKYRKPGHHQSIAFITSNSQFSPI